MTNQTFHDSLSGSAQSKRGTSANVREAKANLNFKHFSHTQLDPTIKFLDSKEINRYADKKTYIERTTLSQKSSTILSARNNQMRQKSAIAVRNFDLPEDIGKSKHMHDFETTLYNELVQTPITAQVKVQDNQKSYHKKSKSKAFDGQVYAHQIQPIEVSSANFYKLHKTSRLNTSHTGGKPITGGR